MDVINHEEAAELAAMKPDSNLARCYLSLRAENEALRRMLKQQRIVGAQPGSWTTLTDAQIDAALSGREG